LPALAACLQINPITVVGLLEVAAVQPGQHLLITAAGSTLGRMLIRAARAEGIKTIGVVRRPEAVQELKESTG
jgi:NADPH:quinone reductase-like Zn-dependent oxidoreductase